jgi:DNA-binding protein H-NS
MKRECSFASISADVFAKRGQRLCNFRTLWCTARIKSWLAGRSNTAGSRRGHTDRRETAAARTPNQHINPSGDGEKECRPVSVSTSFSLTAGLNSAHCAPQNVSTCCARGSAPTDPAPSVCWVIHRSEDGGISGYHNVMQCVTFAPAGGLMLKSSLDTLSNQALSKLRDEIAGEIKNRVESLQREINQLIGPTPAAVKGGPAKGNKVAPKYKGPQGEKWSGRGKKPRWLTIAMSEGNQLEDFLIDTPKRNGAHIACVRTGHLDEPEDQRGPGR